MWLRNTVKSVYEEKYLKLKGYEHCTNGNNRKTDILKPIIRCVLSNLFNRGLVCDIKQNFEFLAFHRLEIEFQLANIFFKGAQRLKRGVALRNAKSGKTFLYKCIK